MAHVGNLHRFRNWNTILTPMSAFTWDRVFNLYRIFNSLNGWILSSFINDTILAVFPFLNKKCKLDFVVNISKRMAFIHRRFQAFSVAEWTYGFVTICYAEMSKTQSSTDINKTALNYIYCTCRDIFGVKIKWLYKSRIIDSHLQRFHPDFETTAY